LPQPMVKNVVTFVSSVRRTDPRGAVVIASVGML
jgi:hypothetical protein